MATNTMRAIIVPVYGGPETLVHTTEHPKPKPKNKHVLVKVGAAACNAADWHIMRGDPYASRLAFGLTKPKPDTVLGNDFAGVVEELGPACTAGRWAPGDRVFGSVVPGAFAEYVCVHEDELARVPTGWSLAEAATLATAGLTALQGLRDAGRLAAGQSVLINGASGGVGTFAVQVAKALGATRVVGVCSARNIELVRGLGADHVIDYAKEDCTQPIPASSAGAENAEEAHKYDVVADIAGSHSFDAFRRVMTPAGRYVAVGGPGGGFLGSAGDSMKAMLKSTFTKQKATMFMATANRTDLDLLAQWASEGKLRTVIAKRYKLEEVPEAIRELEGGHVAGKLVIDIAPEL